MNPSEARLHERALIETFVSKAKRARYLGFISDSRRRRKFLDELYHFADFDAACVRPIEPSRQSASEIYDLLRALGAPDECHVISAHREIDGARLPLASALVDVVGSLEGTVLSCVPGKLAYYEGEDRGRRFVLDLRDAPGS